MRVGTGYVLVRVGTGYVLMRQKKEREKELKKERKKHEKGYMLMGCQVVRCGDVTVHYVEVIARSAEMNEAKKKKRERGKEYKKERKKHEIE